MSRLRPLTFWLLFAALAALFFLALALGGPRSTLDRGILYAAQIDALVPTARLLTHLGAWWAFFGVGALASGWLLFRGRRRQAALLALLILSARVTVMLLKLAFDRARPDPAGHLTAVHSMAFPSGHSASAMVLGLGLALLATASGRGRRAALAFGLAFALIVGLTRLILGVHWPSDVVGGWTLGAAWTLLLLHLFGGTSPSERH